VQQHGSQRPPWAVVIRARRSGTALFGFLTALWLVCLAASVSAQSTASGKIEAGATFGVFLVLSVGGWFSTNRSRSQLEVSHDAIVYRKGNATSYALHRSSSESLRILPPLKGPVVSRPARLTSLGSGGILPLAGFSLDEVGRTCGAQGWRFDGGTELAVTDVQRWLHAGRSAEAEQLIALFGPFDGAAADGDADTGLEAAVLEDYGDKLVRRRPSLARSAYRRAAVAQRAFAGHASSASEGAARMARAVRIDGKAQG
jgi:hypothetical protein